MTQITFNPAGTATAMSPASVVEVTEAAGGRVDAIRVGEHAGGRRTPSQARRYFGVDDLAEVYHRLANEGTPRLWAERFAARRKPAEAPVQRARPDDRRSPGVLRQWWLLTRRNAEVLARNRLTLAVLLGSPLLVTVMMSTLFQRGEFERHGWASVSPAQIVFWLAFDGFFFGLTYGLLQIVGELPIFRREYRSGVGIGAYVAAKIGVLVPVLIGVNALLLGVLRVLGRLPAAGWDVYTSLFVTLVAEAVAALALGRSLVLAGFALVFALATMWVLRRRCRPAVHGRR